MSSSIAPLLKSKRKDLGLSVREVLAKLHEDGIDVSDKPCTVGKVATGNQMPTHFLHSAKSIKLDLFLIFKRPPPISRRRHRKLRRATRS